MHCTCSSLSGRILFEIGGKVLHKGEVEPRNGKLCKYCLLHSSGIMLESVARSLFTLTINEQTIANVLLMFVPLPAENNVC